MIYEVEKTYKTPYLYVNYENGLIKLSGRCISEFPSDNFKDFVENINRYSEYPKENTTFEVFLEYANTSSMKCIFDILRKIESISGTSLTINWIYEKDDEDILELGIDFESLISTKINFIEK